MEFKQVIIVRGDLDLSRGKLAVQVAHAAILGFLKAPKNIREKWLREGQKKIVLVVPSLQELFDIKERAEKLGITATVVRDAGLTEIPPGTVTSLALGPDEEKKIDRITGNLPLLR
jgi:PTH2 family peptidyl-tRNA hydrolase